MKINGRTLYEIESGWYENGVRTEDMRGDNEFINFTINDIFLNYTVSTNINHESIININISEKILCNNNNNMEFIFKGRNARVVYLCSSHIYKKININWLT